MLVALLASLALTAAPRTTELLEQALPDGAVLVHEVIPGQDGEFVEHGRWELTDAAGVVRVKGAMKSGLRAGNWRWRYADGQLAVAGKYREGLRIGAWRFRFADGQKLAQGHYKHGRRAGAWEFTLPDGRPDPTRSGEYTWFERGATPGGPAAAGALLRGLREGRWTYRWPTGGLQLVADFHAGRALLGWDYRHMDGTPDAGFLAGLAAPGVGRAFPEFVLRDLDAEPFAELLPPDSPFAVDAPPAPPTGAVLGERLPELRAPSWRTDDERALGARARPALEALFERRAPSGEPGQSFAELRVVYGPAAFPPVLAALAELDLSRAEDVAWARMLQLAFLAPEALNCWYGWRVGTDAADVAANTLALLRWHSFYACLAELPEAWSFDLRLPSRAPKSGAHTPELLFRIASGYESILHDAPPIPDPRFSHRRSAYEQRGDEARRADTAAIESGLAWLRGRQAPDGSWQAQWFATNARGGPTALDGAGRSLYDVGVTGLAVLAQLGVGVPRPDEPGHVSVTDALFWLVAVQDPETGIIRMTARDEQGVRSGVFALEWIYDHAIATIALAEGTRVTASPLLRRALELAVQRVVDQQLPYSGWRYLGPDDDTESPQFSGADTSATAWMLAALGAARQVGVTVEGHVVEGGLSFLTGVTNEAGLAGYLEPNQASARVLGLNDHYPRNLPTLTAVALMARLESGQRPAEYPVLTSSAELLARQPPSYDQEGLTNDFYYWYHGTRAMWLLGGKDWKRWQAGLREALVSHQRRDRGAAGSWDPNGPWGFAGGRIYSTAMAVLALEAPFQATLEPGSR